MIQVLPFLNNPKYLDHLDVRVCFGIKTLSYNQRNIVSHKKCVPLKTWAEKITVYPYTLKYGIR